MNMNMNNNSKYGKYVNNNYIYHNHHNSTHQTTKNN